MRSVLFLSGAWLWFAAMLLRGAEVEPAPSKSIGGLPSAIQSADGRIVFSPAGAGANSAEPVTWKSGEPMVWHYRPTRWGMYDLELAAAVEGSTEPVELELALAGQTFVALAPVRARGTPFPLSFVGRIYLAKAEPFTLSVRPRIQSDAGVLKLASVRMSPAPEGKPIVQREDTIVLSAADAITHSVLMRYEPATNKNCLGYWANPADTAEWRFTVVWPGAYELELWQGCGKGQGGSEVSVEVRRGAEVIKRTAFVVEDTGHFQNFVPRNLGPVDLTPAGEYSLHLRPLRKQAGAVMDVRQVRLLKATARAEAGSLTPSR